MVKRITLLLFLFFVAALPLSSASPYRPHNAQDKSETASVWQAINFGNGNDNTFYFNKASIHYEVKEGKINKNILVYEEKKVNRNGFTLDNGYYSITDAKVNLANKTIFLGTETFYTPAGKVRWSDKPTYLIWYSVNPGTMGADRFDAVADYAAANPEIIMQQTEAYLQKKKDEK